MSDEVAELRALLKNEIERREREVREQRIIIEQQAKRIAEIEWCVVGQSKRAAMASDLRKLVAHVLTIANPQDINRVATIEVEGMGLIELESRGKAIVEQFDALARIDDIERHPSKFAYLVHVRGSATRIFASALKRMFDAADAAEALEGDS